MRAAPDLPSTPRPANAALAAAIFVILTGIYSLSYSGTFKSGDEYWYIGGALSLGGWGELSATPTGLKSFLEGFGEPLQAVPGAALYHLARLARLGVVHTLFLTNVYVTALTGAVVFWIVSRRGCRPAIAAGAAGLFGLGTLAWPHTRYYFRDPLAMLFTALALLSFELVWARTTRWGRAAQGALTLGLLGAAILTKNTALFALPAFLLTAMLHPAARSAERRLAAGMFAGVAVLGFLAVFVWNGLFGAAEPRRPPVCADGQTGCVVGAAFLPAILGLLASPGKGLFIESPALLLAVAALAVAPKRERINALPAWLTLLGLTVGLAYYEDYLWYGGTGWGIRHLLVAAPMLAAAAAPALEAVAAARRFWVKAAAGGLLLLSGVIQVGAVLLLPEVYYNWLATLQPGAAWTLALWQPAYAEAVGYWRWLLSGGTVDLAWLRVFAANPPAVGGLVAAWLVVLAAGGGVLYGALAGGRWRGLNAAAALLAALAVTALPYGLLRAYYRDPYYYVERGDYRAAADFVTQAARPGDAIVVRGIATELWKFYLNYAYFPVAWYTYYPLAPDAAPPDAVLDAPAAAQALKPESVQLFSAILPARHARLWHISDQCTDWSFLHLEERWLAGQFAAGPPRRFEAGPCATLVSPFALATTPAAPAARLEWQFGAALRLRGITQLTWAEPARLRPGDSLPLRLEWQLSQPAAADYTLGVYLLDEQGGLKAQYDSWARGGFLAMTHWPPQISVFDQRSLELPIDLPPGDYQVAVAVYDWQTGQRLAASEAQTASPDGLARVLRVSVGAP